MKKKNDLLYILKYYKKYKFLLILTFILSWSYAGISLALPMLEGSLISLFNIELNLDYAKIIETALIIMGLTLLNQFVIHSWSCTVLSLNSKVNYDIKTKLLRNILKLKQSNFDKEGPGTFISRINKDSYELSEMFDAVTDNISEILLNIGFVIFAIIVNVWLGLYIVFYLLVVLFITSISVGIYKRNNNKLKQSEDRLMNSYNNLFKGIKDVRNLGLEKNLSPRIEDEQYHYIYDNKKMVHVRRSFARFTKALVGVFNFFFIILSIYLISIGTLSIANFIIVFLYLKNLLSLINVIIELRENLAGGEVAAKRVRELLEFKGFEKNEYGKKDIEDFKGNITFKNVKFGYTEDKLLFNNLNFSIKENTMVAFVGKSGEGKSSILDLISKNYDTVGGKILVDNEEIKELSKNFFDNNISAVLQEPFIFNISVRDNIKMARPSASDEEIIEALKQADLYDFIMSKPDGLGTIVGESGAVLSGGQKQRLAIARALIKKSKIILFDEATSALDNHSQDRVKKILKKLAANHTIIIVAHRLSTIVDSDEIFLLKNHKIAASGSHEDLYNTCEDYQFLYKSEG